MARVRAAVAHSEWHSGHGVSLASTLEQPLASSALVPCVVLASAIHFFGIEIPP